MNAALRLPLLYAVFFVSGFCGLIYESIWSHYLKLILGHAAHAQAVVLIVFVGGLALGAALAGRWSQRIAKPILAYAIVEAVVALTAFCFHAVFVEASAWALDTMLPAMCQAEGSCWASWALAAALILPTSILLGSTFPLMSAGVLRMGVKPGRALSLLYFMNSAGAAIGVLASGYLLIPGLGLPGTVLLTGALNALVALLAFLAVSAGKPQTQPVQTPIEGTRRAPANARLLLLVAGLTGLSSFIYEVVWIRMLTQVLGAATHSFELMLASFIAGLALGGLWVRNLIDGNQRPEHTLALIQLAMGVLAVATLPLYIGSFDAMAFTLRALARDPASYALFTIVSGALAAMVILPAAICAGMTLPVITAAMLHRGGGEGEIGRVYGVNTVGAIAGVLLAVHVLMPALGLKWSIATAAAIDVALGLLILWRIRQPGRGWHWPAVAATAAVAAVAVVPATAQLRPEITASGVFRTGAADIGPNRKLVFHRDGRTATISVAERNDGLRSLLTNGKADGSSFPLKPTQFSEDDPTVILLGVLGMAHHPAARTAAVVGLGTGMTTASLLKGSNIASVETIEIEPLMREAAQLFRPKSAAAFDDPRSRIVIDDARAHLARSTRPYDLIISEPSNPWVSGVSGLFTAEFYERTASRLAPGGHFLQWLQLYEASPEMVGSIIAAFSNHFPEFRVYATNAADIVLVGRADGKPVELDPTAVEHAGFRGELVQIGIDSMEKLAAHDIGRGSLIRMLLGSYGAPWNSDYYPYVDSRASRDRFLKLASFTLQHMHRSPVPVLEFTQPGPAYLGKISEVSPAMPPKLHDLASAYHGDRMLRGATLTPVEVVYLGALHGDYVLTKAWLFDCMPAAGAGPLWNSAVAVAGEVNGGLDASHARALWQSVLDGKCRSRLDRTQLDWVTLFAAVGGRDAKATRVAADRILALGDALSGPQHEYAVLAATTARIALGEMEAARELFAREGRRIPAARAELPWFRYTALLLRVRAKAPAAP
jgi:spermidine synthase